jgi:hypothetical protein
MVQSMSWVKFQKQLVIRVKSRKDCFPGQIHYDHDIEIKRQSEIYGLSVKNMSAIKELDFFSTNSSALILLR